MSKADPLPDLTGQYASDDDSPKEISNQDDPPTNFRPEGKPSTIHSDQDDRPSGVQRGVTSVTIAATIHPAPGSHQPKECHQQTLDEEKDAARASRRVTPKHPVITTDAENVRLDKRKSSKCTKDVGRNEPVTFYYHSDSDTSETNKSPVTELPPSAKKLIVQKADPALTSLSSQIEDADILLRKLKDKSNILDAPKEMQEIIIKEKQGTNSPVKNIDVDGFQNIEKKEPLKKVTTIAQIDMFGEEDSQNGSGPSTPKELCTSNPGAELKSLFPFSTSITKEIPKTILPSAMNTEENPIETKDLLPEENAVTVRDNSEEDMSSDSENYLYEEDEDYAWLQRADSGSHTEEENEDIEEEEDDWPTEVNPGSEIDDEEERIFPTDLARFLRYRLIAEDEGLEWKKDWVDEKMWDLTEELEDMMEGSDVSAIAPTPRGGGQNTDDDPEALPAGSKDTSGEVREIGSEAQVVGEDLLLGTDFVWSDDFATFSGQAERYERTPGPQVGTQDPAELFMHVWDRTIVNKIVKQTNEYARDTIASRRETERHPKELDAWLDVSADVIYRMFAMFIIMYHCQTFQEKDYRYVETMKMRNMRSHMSLDDFRSVLKYLDFTDHRAPIDSTLSPYQRIISKIKPLIDHCNNKFTSLYIPNKHLSLDETLVRWKDLFSWVKLTRGVTSSTGIKSVDLCEAETGYLLRCALFAGEQSSFCDGVESTGGFNNSNVEVVLQLMDGYLDVGHCLVMDNWYNQLDLARRLKIRKTDVIGTYDHRRAHAPIDIKDIDKRTWQRGDRVARHCGDITLIAWKDLKLVTTISTYHKDDMVAEQSEGQLIMKPSLVVEHSKYTGVADAIKNDMLSTEMLDRKQNKWYMRVFKWLLDTSLLNSYIIYLKNPIVGKILTHRQFQIKVAEGLLQRFRRDEVSRPVERGVGRLDMRSGHWPAELVPKRAAGARRQRCVRCRALGKRTLAPLKCTQCNVPLCPSQCWLDYHTLIDLTKVNDQDQLRSGQHSQ